ncbi:FemAB family PEP-CTERM system-associated protein [Gemmata sp. G18]|uniref:FemAB family PEP-CTERM system-associated protein n=1 Tax=Gemmata palustris TaxID=2822762 RepID=A0ABS5BZS7_9BACT|nr:FemAB family XrtA/PEP-CTERM system-associated protein [Gemmata palustris]MBP3959237.1 FemAB family PEP-CTERM system-associated protein [Gemmata palustris]
MHRLMSPTPPPPLVTVAHPRAAIAGRIADLAAFVRHSAADVPLSKHPLWLDVLRAGLGHEVYALETTASGRTVGFLPLACVSSALFGRFLVSLPYLNTNGVVACSADVQAELVTRAAALAEELNVRYLELRHEAPIAHPALNASLTSKVHMRLPLPEAPDQLWKGFSPKVRNQIRKGEKGGFSVQWGGAECLDGFHDVLCANMRDLGSPVYGKELFRAILSTFPGDAEICLLRTGERPVAAALLLHGWGVTEVPTASALKEQNPSNVNMLMYHHLLQRAVERGQRVFDFGRSTAGSSTFKFKKQWGAVPHPAAWQYSVLQGEVGDMRPDNPRYQQVIRLWQRLPVALTRLVGPLIVRGIP